MKHSGSQDSRLPLEAAAQFAKSDEGKQLLQYLQKNQGHSLENAMEQAATGNYDAARAAIAKLLADPQTKAMLERLGDK